MTRPGDVLVGTTLAAYVMDQEDTWSAWLRSATQMRAIYAARFDARVDLFAALELDARGIAPFEPLLERMAGVDVDHPAGLSDHWTYVLDDGRTEVTTANRLRHITFGQNMVNDRACAGPYSHMMFIAADCWPQPDVLVKLVETQRHVVGAHCPTYCLPSKPAGEGTAFALNTFVNPDTLCFSAAAVMLDREAFRKLRWRWDADAGMSDDPCLQHDAWYNHKWKSYVRPDVLARHFPMAVPAIEQRGHDMRVVRDVANVRSVDA